MFKLPSKQFKKWSDRYAIKHRRYFLNLDSLASTSQKENSSTL